MRIFEIVQQHASGYQRLLDTTGREDVPKHLLPPLSALGLDMVAGNAAEAGPGDIVVNELTVPVEADQLDRVVRSVPDGAALLLLIAVPIHEIPVGAVVSALSSAGLQVVQAAPVSHPSFRAAVVACPAKEPVPFVTYLAAGPTPGPDTDQLRRLINEYLVESLVVRAQEQLSGREHEKLAELAERLAHAEAAKAEAESELARQKAKYAALDGSRPLAVGRALASARHRPVSGARQLARAVRGRGATPTAPDNPGA
jgi:hypothetical protein